MKPTEVQLAVDAKRASMYVFSPAEHLFSDFINTSERNVDILNILVTFLPLFRLPVV